MAFEPIVRFVMPGTVDIDNEYARCLAGRNADKRTWILSPELPQFLGILEAVRTSRALVLAARECWRSVMGKTQCVGDLKVVLVSLTRHLRDQCHR